MPKYEFRHRETNKKIKKEMKISERDQFIKEHPEYEQLVTGFPGVTDARPKASKAFQNHLKEIKAKNYGSTMRTGNITEL